MATSAPEILRSSSEIEVSYNTVEYSRDKSGIDCNACSVIRGNIVREIGQNGPSDLHAGYLIGGPVLDVSDNMYIDEQHEYETGTICSVANPSSKAVCRRETAAGSGCTAANGVLAGPTVRSYTDQGNLPIRAFVSSTLLELDDNVAAIRRHPLSSVSHDLQCLRVE